MPVAAKIATLVWDQNNESEVAGYNVYYKNNSPDFPFNGTNLSEGPSPIIVDGSANTSLSLNLPEDGNVYYFTASAIDYNGYESSFSNIVASEWIPSLHAPINNALTGTVVTFEWDQPPKNYKPSTSIVSFKLVYGTDPNIDANAMAASVTNSSSSNRAQVQLSLAVSLAILLSYLIAVRYGFVKRIRHSVCVGIGIGILVLQACFGCGGGDVGGDDGEISLSTNIISDIYDTEYQIVDLQPDTRYYWKVVAVDNFGKRIVSLTQGFTTFGN
jgi:hypothetical protein